MLCCLGNPVDTFPIAAVLNLKKKKRNKKTKNKASLWGGKTIRLTFDDMLKFEADRLFFFLISVGSSSITFTGSSFVKYRLMENENRLEMKLTMRLRTYSSHAVVMYARGTDYSILEVWLRAACDSG